MRSMICLLVAFLPAITFAQEQPLLPASYVAVKLGAIIPQHDDLDGFDNGFAMEGAFGYRLNKNVGVELGIGRFSIGMTESGYVTGVGTVTASEDVVAYPLTASVKLTAPVEKAEIYGLLGGGLYFMSGDIKATAPGYLPVTESDSDTPFAFHFGGGAAFRVSPRAQLGAEIRYFIGKTNLFSDLMGTSTNLDSVIFGAHLAFSL